jgi:predicted choloylglycine hydrolase
MDHLVLKGCHKEIGQNLGHYLLEKKSFFPIKLNKFQTDHGNKSLKLLQEIFPGAYEEINETADVLGCNPVLLGSWLMCMGCCLTIRENHNVEIRGCTVFSFTHEQKVYYGRNNDLPQYLKHVSKSIYYQLTNMPGFLMNTSSFINGEEGINEHGLVVAMTFVVPKKEEIKPGLNSVFLVRYLLENCKNVTEGIKALNDLPVSSSCNILLTDKTMEMAVIECNPLKNNIRYPEKNPSNESFLVTVNHFTSENMQIHDRSKQNVYSSKTRYYTAYNALKKPTNENAVQNTMDILCGKKGFICQYKNIKFDTIWSTVFDVSENKMYLSEGNPETTQFNEYTLFK